MRGIGRLLSVVAVASATLFAFLPAEAQTPSQSHVKPKSSANAIKPMHPHQLTLYPHGRPERRHPAYSYTRHRFNQPSPIHNTFAAPRYY
jgi:hypothetical protein